jgi:radical SAM-linked protein
MPKYLFTFQKTETVRWLGHLDILRTFERAIRRAELPIAFSTGFNPRERLTFASALSTGVTGGAEPANLELTAEVPPDQIVTSLNAALPPAIQIGSCEEVPDAGSRDLLNAFDRADFEVICSYPPETDRAAISDAITALIASPQILVTREKEGRSKSIDIRPLIYQLGLESDDPAPDRVLLKMRLAVGEGGNARPSDVVNAIAEIVPGFALRKAHRVRLLPSGAQN